MLFSPYLKNDIVIFYYFWYYINVTLKGDNKMANKKEVQKLKNLYIYDNDKIVNKIIKIIEEAKKHPDRTGKIEKI